MDPPEKTARFAIDALVGGSRMRGLTLAAVLVSFLTLGSAEASAGVVYERSRDCINPSPAGYTVAGTTSDGSLEILANASHHAEASSLVSRLQGEVLPRLRSEFTHDGHPGGLPTGPRGPYQAFIAPSSDFAGGGGGVTARYCDGGGRSALAIDGGDSQPLSVATHELCHAFTDHLLGHLSHNTWFEEALCEYDVLTITPRPETQSHFDRMLFGDPTVPMDTPAKPHEYAEDRFIQWLAQRLDASFPEFATGVLARSGGSAESAAAVNEAVRNELSSQGRFLPDDLGEFWGDHLLPESEQPFGGSGPQIDVAPIVPNRAETVSGTADIPRLAAQSGTVHLGPSIKQLIVHLAPTSGDVRLWDSYGGHLHNRSDMGETLHFCVGTTVAGTVEWPGEYRFVITNGSTTTQHHQGTFITRTRRCSPPSCPYTSGIYQSDPSTLPYVYFDLECVRGHNFIYVFGGSSTCSGQSGGDPVPFGPAGAGEVIERIPGGQGDIRGTNFSFAYYYGGAIAVHGTMRGDGGSGTVQFDSTACGSGEPVTQDWEAPYSHR